MNDLSHAIRRAAARWLFVELRAKAVAEEFNFGARTADTIAYWPSRTESRTRRDTRAPLHMPRWIERTRELPSEVVIVEVKISRDDFLGGIRKGQIANDGSGLGAFADKVFVAAPPATVPLELIPRGWGLLLYRADRGAAHCLEIAIKPKRLAPTAPLRESADLRERLAQSTWWRHYGYGTDVIHHKHFVPRDDRWGWKPREIVLADEVNS